METLTTDVLVIGAGAAGIRAALSASEAGVRVLVMANKKPGYSGSTFSDISQGWGMQALAGKERTERNLEVFYNEIIEAGLGKCDPELVRILVEESGDRLNDLIKYGIIFRKDSQGNYIRAKGCFSSHKRAFLTDNSDNTKRTFASILPQSVKIITGKIVDLALKEKTCWGAWSVSGNGKIFRIKAKSTILATGGCAGIFQDNLVREDQTGEGLASAYRAGVELSNMEYIQFMLGIEKGHIRKFMPVSDLAKRAALLTPEGEDLLELNIPNTDTRNRAVKERQNHFPFSCRDSSMLIDTAIAKDLNTRNRIFWGIDGPEKGYAITHFAHANNGGIKIDSEAKSSLTGLFAAGEIAAGPHGADRIGGCMITATQVFGMRAGQSAAKRAGSIKIIPEINKMPDWLQKPDISNESCRKNIEHIKVKAKKLFKDKLMILRSKQGLSSCIERINKLQQEFDCINRCTRHELGDLLSLKSMLIAGKIIAESASKNPQPLGSHYRSDCQTPPDSSPLNF